MGNKTSKSADVETLRKQLADMARTDVLQLADRAKVARPTIEKFRNREIGDIGADKYLALVAALATDQAAH
jgi:hypothetical protein